MILEHIKRRDVFRIGYKFRSAVSGRYVSRWFALLNPHITVKERVR